MTISKAKVPLSAWSTADELKFINGMVSRRALAGYIAAATKRADWGGVDVSVVVDAATRRLAWLEGAPAT